MELKIDKSHWTPVKLGDVFTKKEENDKENARNRFDRFLKVNHMDPECLHVKRWASQENSDELNPTFYKIFRKGQILFPTRNPHLRRTVLASFDGICGEKTLTLEPNEEFILPEFMPFLFHSESFYAHTTGAIIGSTNPHCRWRDVANYEFLLPPKDQQAQLAKLLWAMDEVIEKEKEVLRSVEQSYLVKIEKELLNKNSEKTYFKDLGKIIRGVGYKPNDLLDSYTNDTCVILRSNNIFESKINYDDIKILNLQKVKPSQILNTGDFAICMSNGSKDLVGKSAIYFEEGENVSIGSFCAGFRPKNNLSQRIVQHLFASNSYRYGIKRILSGSAINNLKPSDIESLFLRIEEDKTKVDILLNELDSLVKNISILEAKISVSQVLQKSIINQIY